jgi:hypothetical protein
VRISFRLKYGRISQPDIVEARRSGESRHCAIIQQTRDRSGWFWYGDGVNTSDRVLTLDEAKAEVRAHFAKKPAPPSTTAPGADGET